MQVNNRSCNGVVVGNTNNNNSVPTQGMNTTCGSMFENSSKSQSTSPASSGSVGAKVNNNATSPKGIQNQNRAPVLVMPTSNSLTENNVQSLRDHSPQHSRQSENVVQQQMYTSNNQQQPNQQQQCKCLISFTFR